MTLDSIAERSLLWIVLLPLAGAIINGLFGRFANKSLAGAVGVGSVGLAFALALFAVFRLFALRDTAGDDARIVHDVYHWMTLSFGATSVAIDVKFVLDSLSAVMVLVVTGVGLLIHIYSLEYMEDDPGFARFFAYLNLFMASMLILVLGSSMPVMFVGWEGVGLCSYLLIGFWYENGEYAEAGKKAFIVNRIGDFGVLFGMFVLFVACRTLEFDGINAQANYLTAPFYLSRWEVASVATVATFAIFLGCTGKSAQIPLYVWLPDAMAGPTPVSALIHAATMVTAGVYLCARMSPVFSAAPTTMATIAIIGALTALVAASIALVQNRMKRILAYSTVSQLGFMFAAVGSGAFAAGIFHLTTHAFFKACLFLGAGAIMHAVHAHGDADIRKLGGLKDKLPTVHWTFFVSCLAIAGVPVFSGWFSKDEILIGAVTGTELFAEAPWIGWTVFALLVAAATMTAFYMFRMYFLTFYGEYRSAPKAQAEGEEEGAVEHIAHDAHGYDPVPHPPGARIGLVLTVLGAGAAIVGVILNREPLFHLFGIEGGNLIGEWLASSVHAFHADVGALGYLPVAGGLAAAGGGIYLAWQMYVKDGRLPPEGETDGIHRVLMHKWYVDEVYGWVVVTPARFLAVLSAHIDKYFVDGIIARLTALTVRVAAWAFTRIQSGVVYAYSAVMIVGVAAMTWWFTYPHASIEAEVTGPDVVMTAGRGHGYEYRWDWDDDGEPDTEWSAEPTANHHFTDEEMSGLALVLESGRPGDRREIVLDPDGDELTFGEEDLGPDWQNDPEEGGDTPPAAWIEDGAVAFRANDARARHLGAVPEEKIELRPGDTVEVGGLQIRVVGVARTELEVRNAFGNLSRDTIESILDAPPAAEGENALAVHEGTGGAP